MANVIKIHKRIMRRDPTKLFTSPKCLYAIKNLNIIFTSRSTELAPLVRISSLGVLEFREVFDQNRLKICPTLLGEPDS